MSIDYVQLANVVRSELQQFLCTVQQTDSEQIQQIATEQLWSIITRVQEFTYAPSDAQWEALSAGQRWGYLRLESYVGTALHELRQHQRTVWRVAHSPLRGEVHHYALQA